MEWLLIPLLVLTVIVLIGHGTWVLLAWAFRGFRRRTPTLSTDGEAGPLPRYAELGIAARQVLRLQGDRLLRPEACQEVLAAIEWQKTRGAGFSSVPRSVLPVAPSAPPPPPAPTPEPASVPVPALAPAHIDQDSFEVPPDAPAVVAPAQPRR